MAARVGQSLLKGPIGDFAGFPVDLAQLLDVDPRVEPHAGGTCVSDKRIQRFTGQDVSSDGASCSRACSGWRSMSMTLCASSSARRLFSDFLGFLRDPAGLFGQLMGVHAFRFGHEPFRLGLRRARIQRQQG